MSNTTENLMYSSPFSYEMVNEDTNKGKAVLKLAEMLGIKCYDRDLIAMAAEKSGGIG